MKKFWILPACRQGRDFGFWIEEITATSLCLMLIVSCSFAGKDGENTIDSLQRQIDVASAMGKEKAAERARIRLAELLMQEDRLKDAAAQWDRVTQLWFTRKERPRLYTLMGFCYEQLHQYEKAIPAYEQALFWQPKNWRYSLNLARVYRLVDLNAESIPYYEKALKRKNDNFEANFGIANAYAGLQLYDKALSYYVTALRVCPRESKEEVLYTLAQAYEQVGKIREAIATLSQAKPAYLTAKKLGALYEKQGRWDESLNAYQQARKLNGKDTDIVVSMAMVEFKEGKAAQSEDSLTDAIRHADNPAAAYFFRAYVRKSQGDWPQAAEDARRAKMMAETPTLRDYAEKLLASLRKERVN